MSAVHSLPEPRQIEAIERVAEHRFARVRAEAAALDRAVEAARADAARARRMIEMQARALDQLDASGRRRMIGRTLDANALSGAVSTVRQMIERLRGAQESERRAIEALAEAETARKAFEPTLRTAALQRERKIEIGGHARDLLRASRTAAQEVIEEDEVSGRAGSGPLGVGRWS